MVFFSEGYFFLPPVIIICNIDIVAQVSTALTEVIPASWRKTYMNVVGVDRLVTGTTEHQIIHNLQKKKKKCYFYSLLCNNMEVAK